MSDLVQRLRGEYRIPITDGLGPAGGAEPENQNEFVRHFPAPPIQKEAANMIENLAADAARYRWLRDQNLDTIQRGGVFASMTPENVVLNGEDLDVAIDAAMAES